MFLNDSSGASDTGSTKNANKIESGKIYELQDNVLKFVVGGGERKNDENNLTSPKPHKDDGGVMGIINRISPNSPREEEEGEVPNFTSPNSSRENNEIKTIDPSLTLKHSETKILRRSIGHLNVNHIENKFEPFVSLVG